LRDKRNGLLLCMFLLMLIVCGSLAALFTVPLSASAATIPLEMTGVTSGNKISNNAVVNERIKVNIKNDEFLRIYYKTPLSSNFTYTSSGVYISGYTNGLYIVYATKESGEKSQEYSFFYDNVKPEGTIYSEGKVVNDGAYLSKSFSYSATDSGSGISAMYYKTPVSEEFTLYNSGTVIPTNSGDGLYTFYSVDCAGNESEKLSVYLETQAPIIKIYRNDELAYSKTITNSGTFDTDIYINPNDKLKICCDTSSGNVTSNYTLDTNITIGSEYSGINYTIDITTATGIASHFTYHIVRNKPIVVIDDITYTDGDTIYFNQDKSVNFVCDSVIENLGNTGVTISSEGNVNLNEYITFASGNSKTLTTVEDTETKYDLLLNDRAGNESAIIVIIDKFAPQGVWQSDGNELANGSYTQQPLTFKFTEAGITGMYSFNGGEYKTLTSGQTFIADGTYIVILSDRANNRSTFTAHIDTVAPTGQLYANYSPVHNNTVTNGRVYFTWDGTENTATVNGQAYEKNTVLTENGIYTFVLTDLAKNSTTYIIEIDTVAPTYNAYKLHGSKLTISKWYSVTFDKKDYSFATYTEALAFTCGKEFDKSVTVLMLDNIEDFNQHHLIAGNSEVRTGEYWLYKSPANAESYLYYFDRNLLDEVIAFYAKDYISGANHFIWNGDNVYGETADSMIDNVLFSENGTEAPALNGVVFDKVDGKEFYAELVGGNGIRVKLNYGLAIDKQISQGGLYKLTEVDEANNETVFFGILDTVAPALKVTATIYGNDAANELNITQDSLTSIAAYYYVSFEVGAIVDADKWSVLSVESSEATTYYTLGDELPCLMVGGEYLLTVYDRFGNYFSFTVYIVGNPATITIQNNADDTAFNIAITLGQNFNTIVSIEICRNDEAVTNVSTNVLNYTFDRAGYYKITLRDNFGRLITKEYVFNKALPSGTLAGVINGGKTKTDVVFTFDSTKYFASVKKDGQDYATKYNGELYFFATDLSSGYYTVRLTRLTDAENYTDYTFLINTLAPEFNLSIAEGTTTNKSVIVTWTASDIETVTYTLNGGEVIQLQNGAVMSDDGEYTVVAMNDLGTQSVKIFAIDKTLDYDILIGDKQTVGVDTTNKDITVVNNEPLFVSVKKDGSPYDFEFGQVISAEGIYGFRIFDEYGNTTTFTVVIDKSVDLKATTGNGVITNEDVVISADEKVNLIVTKNGKKYGYEIETPITEEGFYQLTAYDLFGNEKTLSFEIVKGTKTKLDYTLGNNVEIKSIHRGGEAVSADGNRLNFMIDGTYTVVCKTEGKEYTFILSLDTTAPTVNLNGIEDGGKGNVTVTITDLSEAGIVAVYKDGKKIDYNLGDELKEYGAYEVRVSDELGNERIYKFTLEYQMNGGAIALIIIGILVTVGIVIAVILGKRAIYKKRSKKMVEDVDGFYEDADEE